MRKACYLCQVGVMFQQRMCRLFCMALDVRFKGSLSAWCELLCQHLVCMRAVCSSCDANNMGVVCSAVFSATVVLFVLQLSLLCSVVCFAVVSATVGVGCLFAAGCAACLLAACCMFVPQLSLRSWCCLFCSCLCNRCVLFVRAVFSAARQARCVFRSCDREREAAVQTLNSRARASAALSWPTYAAGAASASRTAYRKGDMAQAMVGHSHFPSRFFFSPSLGH